MRGGDGERRGRERRGRGRRGRREEEEAEEGEGEKEEEKEEGESDTTTTTEWTQEGGVLTCGLLSLLKLDCACLGVHFDLLHITSWIVSLQFLHCF